MIDNQPGTPCPLCQVRPDVACRHRPADPNWSMGEIEPEKRNGIPVGSTAHYKKRVLRKNRTPYTPKTAWTETGSAS